MKRAISLLALLADGREHSGASLANLLGVGRAAVWNQVNRLRSEGVAIEATPGQGYVLRGGFEPIDTNFIDNELATLIGPRCFNTRVLDVTDSTNQQLLNLHHEKDIHSEVLFAEYQTAGRGRRGDKWISPPGSGLCFSLGWLFEDPPATFSALSLVVGISLLKTLKKIGLEKTYLKWPNDLITDKGKLAGILIELRSQAGGPATTVIGIGLNMHVPVEARSLVDQPVDDVHRAVGKDIRRNDLATALLADLHRNLSAFASEGFPPFRDVWMSHDSLAGKRAELNTGNKIVRGVGRGVDDYGAILLEENGNVRRYLSGHIREAKLNV